MGLTLADFTATFNRGAGAVRSGLRGLRRGRGAWRLARVLSGVFAGATLVGVLGFGALMLRLDKGPIEIDAFGEQIAASLSDRTGLMIDFGATHISRTDKGPTIVVDRLTAKANGKVVVQAPHAIVSLDPLSLLRLEARPRYLEALDLDIKLIALPDGGFAFSAGGDEGPIRLTPPLGAAASPEEPAAPVNSRQRSQALLRQASAAMVKLIDFATSSSSALGGVRHIGVKGGRLTVHDQALDRTTTFSDVEIALEKSGARAAFGLKARAPGGSISAQALAKGARGAARTLDAEIRGLSLDEIVLAAGVRKPAVESDARLDARGVFALDAAGAVTEASARFLVGAGYLRFDDPDHEPLFFDEISGGLRWDKTRRRAVVEPTHYFAGDTRLAFAGEALPPDVERESWAVALGLVEPGRLAPERPREKSVTIDRARLDAQLFLQRSALEIRKVELAGPNLSVEGAGAFDWIDGPHLKANLSARNTDVRSLMRVWPSPIAARPRGWILGHVRAGTVQSARVSVDFDKNAMSAMRRDMPPNDGDVSIEYQIAGGALAPFDGAPDIVGIEGAGRASGRSAYFTASSGSMDMGRGRRLTLGAASFAMPGNNGERATPAQIEMRVQGSMESVADLLDREAIKPHASLPLAPETLKGAVDGRLKLDFKVGPDATSDDIGVYVNANVTNFVVEKIVGKEKFESPLLTVVGDPRGIQATGSGKLFGAPATLDLRKGVGQPATAVATATLDEAARARIGMTMAGVSGQAVVRLNATLTEGPLRANVEVDLARVGLDSPVPGLVKPAGRPGSARFVLHQREDSIRLEELSFEAGGASARGTVELTGAGEFVAARLAPVRLSPGDELRVDAQRSGDVMKVVARGGSIDARPFLKSFTQATDAKGKDGPDFDLEVKSPIVSGYGKRILSNVDFKMSRRAGIIRQLAVNAHFGRNPLAVSLARGESGAPQVSISTSDGGELLAFTDLYSRMEGGALASTMQLDGRTVNGMVQIRDFYLREEPALKRLVVEGAAKVDQGGARRIDPGLVKFDRLQTLFTRSGGRLELREGMMSGADIGLTVEGVIDETRNTMNLNGTFVPAFAINNFFSKIPLVGMLLTGGWNEGLIAVNYRLGGSPGAPQLTINPLSAVAPGFLRKLFGAIEGAGGQQR